MLFGKNILLGVTGSIAAYKTAFLVRLLKKAGANVQVVLTPSAKDFVTPLTLSTLSERPVYSDYFDDETGQWNNHVDFAHWADLMIIAPATASTMSKMAEGHCDNLLLATYLSAECPVFYAPAMDREMFQHPSTKANMEKLKSYGVNLIPPGEGELASGLEGEGRMAEPEEIIEILRSFEYDNLPLSGKKVMVTAGPTYETIDPVRFIGNHSSGKMGYEIATAALKKGAYVTLISGPTGLECDERINKVNVTSANDMYKACREHASGNDIVIMAAAVADYTPSQQKEQKIKKDGDDTMTLELVATPDILSGIGKEKKDGQIIIGFALETENELDNARKKLKKKHVDAIVLNSLRDEGAGFGHDTNKITVLSKDNKKEEFELKTKKEVASDIINLSLDLLNNA